MRPAGFELSLTRSGGVATISITGELDVRTLDELATLVEDALGHAGTNCLALDLRALTFMDSSGLCLLVELHDRASQEPWDLQLVAPQAEEAALVLRVSGADKALPFRRLMPIQEEQSPDPPALVVELDRDNAAPGLPCRRSTIGRATGPPTHIG